MNFPILSSLILLPVIGALFLWKFFDGKIIDGFGPDGISSFIKKCSIKANKFQSGFIYQYAFVMLVGFSAFLTFLIVR